MSSKPRSRPQLFSYPALPEIKLCFLVTILSCAYGWYLVYTTSKAYAETYGPKGWGTANELPLIGETLKDESNWEWKIWRPHALGYLTVYLAHTVFFNLLSTRLPEQTFTLIYTILSILASAYIFTPLIVGVSIAQGLAIYTAFYFFPSRAAVWLSAAPLIYWTHTTFMTHPLVYIYLTFASYTIVSYISYCLDNVESPVRPLDDTLPKQLLRMFFFTYYQPYLVSLIVLYKDFERQIDERSTKRREWRETIVFGLRLAFWWLITDLVLHFFYFESMFTRLRYVSALDKKAFVALGMALGQFFHLKYVVIFGLPSLFARLDNMTPPQGPMCLARVCLYSNVWRSFDRGLYAFFKRYLFVPICEPDFTLPKKIFGVIISYAFVLLWHGFHHHNIVWILLNVAALFMEMSAKALYVNPTAHPLLTSAFSPLALRRLLGWLQIIPFAFGLFSNFYFLGGSKVGALFVQRVVVEEILPVRPFFLVLATMGYFYTQTTMEA